MSGQIIPRGDRIWLIRIFLGRDPATGKRRFHNHTVHGGRKDAEKYRNAVLRERDLGTFIEPATITIDNYLDQWLQNAAKPRLRERTFFEYGYVLKLYVRPVLGAKRLCDLQPLEIQSLYGDMQTKGLSPRTV